VKDCGCIGLAAVHGVKCDCPVDDLLAALKETWTFLEQAPEFPYRLLADAEELQEIVKAAIAKAEPKECGE
jgi:hypothetical protein